jgi:thermitase
LIVTIALLTVSLLPTGSSAIVRHDVEEQTLTSVSPGLRYPNDRYIGEQWALRYINLTHFITSTTGKKVLVAVLDTGIDSTHEDLAGKVVTSVNFTDSPTSDDIYGHGTPIAGIIAAQADNSIGISGIAPQAMLMNIKVADDSGICRASVVAQGIYWAVDNGASVINISLELRDFSKELEKAVNYAWSRGSIIVAAAGNDAGNIPVYPAFFKNCIAVSAISQTDEFAPLSNHGDWVDVAAPGFEIYSTLPDNSYGYETGTSVAAAHVSGLAALLLSVVSDNNGNGRTNDEVRRAIENGCRKVLIDGIGYEVIDVSRSLNNPG